MWYSSQIPTGSRRSYDANFKLMVIKEAEATNNCAPGRKFCISKVNILKWRQSKEKLRNANSSQKSFSGPKKGRYHELEQKVIEYVREKRNEALPITREVIRMKVWVCTNRQHGRYGIQSNCGLVHANDEKIRSYVTASNNTHTTSFRRICRKTCLISAPCD